MVVWPMRHDFTGFVVGWSVMSAAMMVPTILRPMQRIAAGRASRAMSFGSGYVLVWAVLALPAWIVVSYWPINSLTPRVVVDCRGGVLAGTGGVEFLLHLSLAEISQPGGLGLRQVWRVRPVAGRSWWWR